MDVLAFLAVAGRCVLGIAMVAAPVLLWRSLVLFTRPYRPFGGWVDATVIAGAMLGLGALAVMMPHEALTLHGIILVNGFWDLTLPQFLDVARFFVVNGPHRAIAALQLDDARGNLQAWFGLWLLVWSGQLLLAGIASSPWRLPGVVLAELATLLGSLVGALYVGPLLLWLVNWLNYWSFLLLILLIQWVRYAGWPLRRQAVQRIDSIPARMVRAAE